MNDRFFSKTKRNSDTGCLEWTAGLTKSGYGRFRMNDKTQRAHRVAWFLEHGEFPELDVLHACDNRKCVENNHLFLGTDADNMQDKVAKGRQSRHIGEKNPSAVLTEEVVRLIRTATGSTADLARQLGLKYHTVYQARKGINWSAT